VCFQEAQTLPLFLVQLKSGPGTLIADPPWMNPTASPPTNNHGGTLETGPPSSMTTRTAFEQFDTDTVLSYLTSQGVKLDDREQRILRDQKIDGEALLAARKEDLERVGLPSGVVLKIFRVIPSSEKVSRGRILFYALAVLVSLVAILLGISLR